MIGDLFAANSDPDFIKGLFQDRVLCRLKDLGYVYDPVETQKQGANGKNGQAFDVYTATDRDDPSIIRHAVVGKADGWIVPQSPMEIRTTFFSTFDFSAYGVEPTNSQAHQMTAQDYTDLPHPHPVRSLLKEGREMVRDGISALQRSFGLK